MKPQMRAGFRGREEWQKGFSAPIMRYIDAEFRGIPHISASMRMETKSSRLDETGIKDPLSSVAMQREALGAISLRR
jgi:hypothetical protein